MSKTEDFVDVHVSLDWVIRVRGTTDAETGKNIATDYVADQSLERLVEVLVHEDGVLCEGEWMTADTDEAGNLAETALTVELWPDTETLPTDGDVAVSTYHEEVQR